MSTEEREGADGIGELAIETALVMHVEQFTGGAAVACHCGRDATLYITSEPDMEPGPVCTDHAWEWIDVATGLLLKLFPRRVASRRPHEPRWRGDPGSGEGSK